MTTRFVLPLGLLSAVLGLLALAAGARGYPLLLLVVGGVLLARLCFSPCGSPVPPSAFPPGFRLPPVDDCPLERLGEARDLAARVLASADEERSPHRRS